MNTVLSSSACCPPACDDSVHPAAAHSSLSQLGPTGMIGLKGSGPGGWGETDSLCCYLALCHIMGITHGTATVNDGIKQEGSGAEQMNCFPS